MGQEENTELREKLEELEEDITDQQAVDLEKILRRSLEDLEKILRRSWQDLKKIFIRRSSEDLDKILKRYIAVNNSFRRGRRPPMKSCSCSTSSWSGSRADWRRWVVGPGISTYLWLSVKGTWLLSRMITSLQSITTHIICRWQRSFTQESHLVVLPRGEQFKFFYLKCLDVY